jgi:hypothetical protein
MNVVFVHGWSVQNTNTYGGLPAYVATLTGPDGGPISVGNIFLGRYISFEDSVTLDDISRAFHQALKDTVMGQLKPGERFACITHSTGGPVVRNWISLYYNGRLDQCPLSHLIMCAPANHGSALAQLGKGTLSRMKSFFEGAQPGQRVLDWLELGSVPAWDLNANWIDYDCVAAGIYPFCLIGQTIDRKFYDALNSYTDEMGSDGVVRVAAANLNYSLLNLAQGDDGGLVIRKMSRSKPTAFGVLPKVAHSGPDIGIVNSVSAEGTRPPSVAPGVHPTAQWVKRCLQVASAADYAQVQADLDALTAATQVAEKVEIQQTLFGERRYPNDRCLQIIFRLCDDRGQVLTDFDLLLTAGPDYSEQELPTYFFVDRQRNRVSIGRLTYYLNWDVLDSGLRSTALLGKFGFRVIARPTVPSPGDDRLTIPPRLAGYRVFDFRSNLDALEKFVRPNETLMVDFELKRFVDAAVFQIDNGLTTGPISQVPLDRTVA